MVELATKCASAWNQILSSEKIPLYLRIDTLPNNINDTLFDANSSLNLIGITNNSRYLPRYDIVNSPERFTFAVTYPEVLPILRTAKG